MDSKEFNKQRILSMARSRYLHECPHCNEKVYPRFVLHQFGHESNLYWCPKCLKGEAKIFWYLLEY